MSRFVGSIPQSSPPSYPVRVFPHVAPYFSCFAAASRSTFIPYRNIRGARTTIRADLTYRRQLKKFRSHWPRSRFHSTLCGRGVARWGQLAVDWPSHDQTRSSWSRRHRQSARSSSFTKRADDSGNQVGNCLGLCAARYSHRGTPCHTHRIVPATQGYSNTIALDARVYIPSIVCDLALTLLSVSLSLPFSFSPSLFPSFSVTLTL